ncbi:MAG: hypothetical protein KJ579_07010 [Verrucomicrobia bacterium]|nr:hypothetical protein [Verrucomicrobiota bacterium]
MKGLNLKQLLAVIVGVFLMVAILLPAAALAADKGPQRAAVTVTTNSATVSPPIGDTARFAPQWMTLTAPAGVTSAVTYVASGHTGTVSAAAATGLLVLTNVPTMFYGDYFKVVSSADTNGTLLGSNSISVKVIGTVFD